MLTFTPVATKYNVLLKCTQIWPRICTDNWPLFRRLWSMLSIH